MKMGCDLPNIEKILHLQGENLLKLRQIHGLTQDKMAQRIGVDRKTYRQWELGKERVGHSCHIDRIMYEFGVGADYVLGYTTFNSLNNEMICTEIGLADASIENFRELKQMDVEEWSRSTLLNYLDIADTPRCLLETINAVLGSEHFIKIVLAIDAFLHPEYCIPVHFQSGNWVAPDHDSLVIKKSDGTVAVSDCNDTPDNVVWLAKNKENPSDNRWMLVNNIAIQANALQTINIYLHQIKRDYDNVVLRVPEDRKRKQDTGSSGTEKG